MSLFDLSGTVAVVTGGTRGIGLMAAHGLRAAGASVVVASRDAAACAAARDELGGDTLAVPTNLADVQGCDALVEAVTARHGRVHLLVNNAGAAWGAPLAEYPPAAWDKVLTLNLTSPFLLVQRFLPLLERAATPEAPARIVNIGSVDGLSVPTYPNYAYAASKAGLHQLTRILAVELGPRRITCNALAPGPFPSKMMAATLREQGAEFADRAPGGRIGEPDDIAGALVFLASRAGRHVTGAVLPLDGGLSLTR